MSNTQCRSPVILEAQHIMIKVMCENGVVSMYDEETEEKHV